MTIFGPKKAKNTIGAPSIPVYDQFFSICMAKSELKKQELEGSGKGALYDSIFVFREPPKYIARDFLGKLRQVI